MNSSQSIRILATAFTIFSVAGCEIVMRGGSVEAHFVRPVVEVRNEGRMIYRNYDQSSGLITYQGYPDIRSEAVVSIDGNYFFTMQEKNSVDYKVERVGTHTYHATLYTLDAAGKRDIQVGEVKGTFVVSATNRSSRIPGYWWELHIPTSE